MKAKIFTLFLIVFSLVCQATEWPTTVVKVEPDQGTSIGALEAAITANGSAIYELKRGELYLTNGQYKMPSNTPVIIRAEEGTGPRPVILGGVPTSGYPAGDNVIRINSDVKFENIYFTGEDMNGVVHKNTVRIQAGAWFEFNGCTFDKDNAASIRNGVGDCTYIFNNCSFRNQVDYTGLANGRGWDARDGFNHITLIMKNCSFYNISSRIIRPSTSDFDSIVFVNNTCYNIHEALPLGIARKAIVNNNIFYNTGIGGTSSPFSGTIDIDSIGGIENADAARSFELRNNLFYVDQQYLDIMVSDTLYKRNILNLAAKEFAKSGQMVVSDTIVGISIPFTNPSPLILGYVQYMWENGSPSSFTPTAEQRIEAMEDPLNFGDPVPPVVAFNFGYPTTHMAYTAGLNGTILGDKKYFGPSTGIQNIIRPESEVNVYFSTSTSTVNLIFKKADVGSYVIRIFDLSGKQLANRSVSNYGQLFSKVQIPGLKNGFYLYEINGKTLEGKMLRATGKLAF